MFTKPLTRPTLKTLDLSKDANSISRLLIAAAVSPTFCARLLADPQQALKAGFGGEGFPLSRPTFEAVVTLRASTLPELAFKLNEMLSNQSQAT